MKKIICEKLPRILKNKKKLSEVLGVTLTNRGKEVYIEGSPEKEYIAEKVIDAINFGFAISKESPIEEAFISGTTKGTSSSYLNALLLSITKQPASQPG